MEASLIRLLHYWPAIARANGVMNRALFRNVPKGIETWLVGVDAVRPGDHIYVVFGPEAFPAATLAWGDCDGVSVVGVIGDGPIPEDALEVFRWCDVTPSYLDPKTEHESKKLLAQIEGVARRVSEWERFTWPKAALV